MRNHLASAVSISLFSLALLIPTSASAGKPERDKVDELTPIAAAAAKQASDACGCTLTVTVDWDSYAKLNDMSRIKDTISSFVDATRAYCQKQADKDAVCKNVEGANIKHRANSDEHPGMKGKIVSLTSSEFSFNSQEQVKNILGEF